MEPPFLEKDLREAPGPTGSAERNRRLRLPVEIPASVAGHPVTGLQEAVSLTAELFPAGSALDLGSDIVGHRRCLEVGEHSRLWKRKRRVWTVPPGERNGHDVPKRVDVIESRLQRF